MRALCTWSATLVIAAAALAIPSSARAEQTEADKLFDEAAALMKAGKYSEACPKFEASNKLDPEIGGLLWLADCYERNTQTASAYRTYQDAQKMAVEKKDKQQRDKVAQKHLTTLEGHLTKITILGPPESRPEGMVVTRDGEKLGASDLGLAVMVDPGPHVVTVTAPHFKKWEQKVDARGEGNTITVTIGPLDKEVAEPSPTVVEEGDPGFALHVGGIIVATSGLLAIGVGSALGLVAAGKLGDSNADGHCDTNDTCDAVGLGLRSDAKSAALVSTILFISGGVAVAAGITMFFLAPKKKHTGPMLGHVAPAIGNGYYGMALGGSF